MTTSVSSSTNSTVAPTTSASTAALSSPGIGSGLDVTSIVAQLMAVEQAPLTALQTTATSYQADLSAYSTVQGAMSGLQIAAQGLANPANLNTINASVGNSSLLSATAGANALAGSYSVEVKTLATSQKLARQPAMVRWPRWAGRPNMSASWRTARGVRPSPQVLTRGKCFFSTTM